jgi:hypothetical protein
LAIRVGFLDRFFKKPSEKAPQESTSMGLDEVSRWAKEAQKEIQEDSASELNEVADEILRCAEEAIEVVEEIRDFKPPAEIKKRIFKPVKTAKPKFVKGMMDGLSNIRPLKDESYDTLIDFNTKVKKALKIIHTVQMNQGRIIAMFFQEEIPRLGTALNCIIDNQKSIEESIEDADKKGQHTASIKAKAMELRSAKDSEKQSKKKAKEKRAQVSELEKKRTEYEEGLEKLRDSPEHAKLQETKNEIINIQEKIAAVESKGRSLLGPIIRVLRKFAREAHDKETKKTTELYIKSPQKALFEKEEGATKITLILKEVLGMADRGELKVDEKRREKVLNALASLGSIKEEHTALQKEKQEIERRLESSGIKEEEEKIKSKLEYTKTEIEKLKAELVSAKGLAKEKRAEIKTLKKGLEEDLTGEMGQDITIEI